MAVDAIDPALRAVMQRCMASTFGTVHSRQEELRSNREPIVDMITYETRGRYADDEATAILGSVSEIAHPYQRAQEATASAQFEDAGLNHGWPSYRATHLAPTDGEVALAITWRFTVPHRETVIREVEAMWRHRVGTPIVPEIPRPEVEPITTGETALHVGPGMTVMWLKNGDFDDQLIAWIEDSLKPRVYTEGGVELLSSDEVVLLRRVMTALVDTDRAVLDEIGAYEHESDPYMWTRDYGGPGEHVHFAMPPGDVADWDVRVMRVDDQPGVSFLVVDMWTAEEGPSDLSLEINLYTDPETGAVRGEFDNLHVM